MAADRPLWRQAFDAVDTNLGPRMEELVRSEQFADGVAFLNRLNKQAIEAAERLNRQAMHFWNRPTASDVAELKKQLAAMQRQLRAMAKQLEEGGRGND
jgi:polyhydroxyalkanoate synthesis regulator protein